MSSYVIKKTDGDTGWFIRDRFGMFIHFGVYAAGARGEWFQSIERIPAESYARYASHFDPDLFDAKDWARKARRWYAVRRYDSQASRRILYV